MTMNLRQPVTRRRLLKSTASVVAGTLFHGTGSAATPVLPENSRQKMRVAGVVTVYHTSSHADVILGKILDGYQQDGGTGPDLNLASLYVDQIGDRDLSRKLAAKHDFRLARTIDEAITLGTDQVQVSGVISIGEHGTYPLSSVTKQRMYPRKRFFDEIVAAFRRCGKSVPVFNDKHLSWRWEDARQMVQDSRDLGFPLLAGSSLPVAWRYPELELPMGSEIEGALTIGYGGLEDYGFHAIEAHQCLIERRSGGESGISSVQAIQGDAILRSESEGRWSRELFVAALQTMPGSPGDSMDWIASENAAVYLLRHRDGMQSAVVMANGLVDQFASAIRLKGRSQPLATWFRLQEGPPFGHFAFLVRALDHMVHAGKTTYPVERTLLTTGVTARVMESLAMDGKLLESPELDVSYSPTDWPFANHPDSPLTLPHDG